jgi:hypothetical protein
MSPDRDDRNDDPELDTYEEEPPRSIFAATWFRAVLILIVLGVIGAVAVPYILDAVNPPATQQAVVKSAPLPPSPPPVSPSPAPTRPPAAPAPAKPDEQSTATPRAMPAPATPRATPPPAALPEPTKPAMPAAKAPGAQAKAEVPAAKPAPSMAKPEPARTSASGTSAAAPDNTPKKPAAGSSATAQATGKPAAKKPADARPSTPRAAAPATTGAYWVQVGAFKDEETARRLATRLREQNFKVADVTPAAPAPAASAATPPPSASTTAAPAGPDQYDVFVTGLPPAELNTRLTAKGLAAETSGTGVVIKPSLPLRDAVSLSKDLAVEGYKVQVRRAGGASPRPQPPAPAATTARAPAAGDGLYRVRVGSFTERTAAVAALRELEAKGYKPFIARGER